MRTRIRGWTGKAKIETVSMARGFKLQSYATFLAYCVEAFMSV
jgi:hypothetical protein